MSSTLEIFLAEDNAADVYMIREALTDHELDFHLHIAKDGEEAETLITEAEASRLPMDVFLIDLNLPKKPGHEVLQHLREAPWWAHAIIIVVTSSDSPSDREAARRLGAHRYFRKPSRLREYLELGAVVKELCQERGIPV